MSSFTSFDASLKIEFLSLYSEQRDRNYYKVLEEFRFYSNEITGRENPIWICVDKGFVTDGVTSPKFFWGWFPPMGREGQAAVLHDWCLKYRTAYWDESLTMPFTISRKECDRIFKEALKVLKVGFFKRNVMYYAVRIWAKINKYK